MNSKNKNSQVSSNIQLVNVKNGTIEVTRESIRLKDHDPEDLLTYQLPIDYNPEAKAPIFQEFLDKLLPEKQAQMVLAEHLGSIFIKNGSNIMKVEKTLLLFTPEENPGILIFKIIKALFGEENISTYSIQKLTNKKGNYRAKLADKLVNYSPDLYRGFDTSIFKGMVYREPFKAQLSKGQPFYLNQYAKLIFNFSWFPGEVEWNDSFFRRLLVIPFYTEVELEKQLANKIIQNELPGILNWVMEGLRRLIRQKRYTSSELVTDGNYLFKENSDTVNYYVANMNHKEVREQYRNSNELITYSYEEYCLFCKNEGKMSTNEKDYSNRLRNNPLKNFRISE